MEALFGTYLDSYDNLPRLLWTIRDRNLGTYIDIQHSLSSEFPNLNVLHRAFFAFWGMPRSIQSLPPSALCGRNIPDRQVQGADLKSYRRGLQQPDTVVGHDVRRGGELWHLVVVFLSTETWSG